MTDLQQSLEQFKIKATSPRKQAAVVAGLASKYAYQFGGKKHESVTNETKGKVEVSSTTEQTWYIPCQERKMRRQLGQRRVEKEFGNTF